jgi:aryl-alcohol dehydrogenase-like predicted oxidoreductase
LGGGLHHGGRRTALDLIAHALELGITLFDTADHYSLGESERLLGLGLRSARSHVVIASKVGTCYTPMARAVLRMRPLARPFARLLRPLKLDFDQVRSAQRRGNFSPTYIIKAVEASLKRLRTDYLDLLQLHKPPPAIFHTQEIPAAVEALQRAGKIRYFGVACDTVSDAVQCAADSHIASLQVTINLLDRTALEALLPKANERGLGVIARNPRAAGLLAAGYGDITGETYAIDRASFEHSRAHAAQFAFLATCGRTLSQAAIQFVLQLAGVAATIPRALTHRQLDEFAGATRLPPLTTAELAKIAAVPSEWKHVSRKYPYRPASPQVDG